MKFRDKIKWRLDLLKGLIRYRKEITDLYSSFDDSEKKDFRSILKLRLIKSFKPCFLFNKGVSQDYNFYNPRENSFIFENYIFKSIRLKQDSQKTILKTIQDFSFLIEEILITKVYEDKEVKIESGDIVLDCGAHIGIFSIYAAKKANIVYAFEPSKEEVASMYENKKLNNCNNIKIIPSAVLDTTRNAKLILVGTASHFIVNKDNEANGGNQYRNYPY